MITAISIPRVWKRSSRLWKSRPNHSKRSQRHWESSPKLWKLAHVFVKAKNSLILSHCLAILVLKNVTSVPMSCGTAATRFPAPSRFGLGLGTGEFPEGVSDSGRSSHRLDLQWSLDVEVSTESFFDFPFPLNIFRLAADKIPDMMSLAVLKSRLGLEPELKQKKHQIKRKFFPT